MTHDEKVTLMLAELSQHGVGRWTSAPPMYRALWKAGFEVPPPMFSSFGQLFAVQGIGFGVLWGLFVWSFVLWLPLFPIVLVLPMALCAGSLFGLCMAAYYRWQAKRLKLPTWSKYGRA
jgi:hypothetical protein